MMRAVALMLFLAAAPLWAEWTLAAYLGGAHTLDNSLLFERPAQGMRLRLEAVPYEGRSFRRPLYYGYRIGYFPHRHFGFDAEFIHAKAYSLEHRTVRVDGVLEGEPVSRSAPMNEYVSRFSISHGLNLILGNAVVRHDFLRPAGDGLGRLLVTGRVGGGGTVSHPETTVLGLAREDYQAAGPAIQAAGGAELRLWRGLHGLGEYKFTRTRQNVGIAAGTARGLFRSHHGVFGIAWHF